MAAEHGVRVKEVQTGPQPVSEVPSAITALVGIAPKGPKESLIRVNSAVQAVQFGSMLPDFTIPQALFDHFNEGGAPVLVVNIFDETIHTTDVTNETLTLVNGRGKTVSAPIANLIVTGSTGTPTYQRDVAYKIDDAGNIQSIDNSLLPHNTALRISYKKLDITKVTSAMIVGTVDAVTKARKGFKLLENSRKLHGVDPKLIICPEFCTSTAVVAEMRVWANKFMGQALIDEPKNTLVGAAIAGRGPLGAINFFLADERVIACYPRQKGYNPVTDTYEARGFSAFLSGIIGKNDRENDIHFSPDNRPIVSSIGPSVEMTASFVDPDTDGQALNNVGIVTCVQEGTQLRVFGNRSSAFPDSSKVTTFISVRRVQDIAMRSLQFALVPFIGKPMVESVRDGIVETANDYLRSLVGREALIDGIAFFDPDRNPTSQTSQGKWVLTTRSCPPPPAEQIDVESYVDITLLEKLNQTT